MLKKSRLCRGTFAIIVVLLLFVGERNYLAFLH